MTKDVFLMLDLETLGNRINPCIVQISAVPFTLEGGVMEEDGNFNELVEQSSCEDLGLEVDNDTVLWWSEQSSEAIYAVFGANLPRKSIHHTLLLFTEYINSFKEDGNRVYLWGNGIRADNVWLLSAYKAAGLKDPIGYADDLDYRTLHYLAKKKSGIDFKKVTEFKGVQHNAIDDCKYQIECAMKMWGCLNDD